MPFQLLGEAQVGKVLAEEEAQVGKVLTGRLEESHCDESEGMQCTDREFNLSDCLRFPD
jgi:hypothetical protein